MTLEQLAKISAFESASETFPNFVRGISELLQDGEKPIIVKRNIQKFINNYSTFVAFCLVVDYLKDKLDAERQN